MEELKELIKLAKETHIKDLKRGYKEHLDPFWYFEQIKNETNEAMDEVKRDNTPHLEDELADVLWAWLMCVENLKGIDFIEGHESVLRRALKKYNERMKPLNGEAEHDEKIWKEVKQKQKEALEREVISDS